MCNLYRLSSHPDEIAAYFSELARDPLISPGGNMPEMIYPGTPGLVRTRDALARMIWGFPLSRKGSKGQTLRPKPVNNARTDKLASPFWSASFHTRRCLIPVSAFAEAEGAKGAKTRTWFTLPGSDLMAVAGLWRMTPDWGAAYTMVMTDANEQIAPVHDRMPVILPPDRWEIWLCGEAKEAEELCRPYTQHITVTRTQQAWSAKS